MCEGNQSWEKIDAVEWLCVGVSGRRCSRWGVFHRAAWCDAADSWWGGEVTARCVVCHVTDGERDKDGLRWRWVASVVLLTVYLLWGSTLERWFNEYWHPCHPESVDGSRKDEGPVGDLQCFEVHVVLYVCSAVTLPVSSFECQCDIILHKDFTSVTRQSLLL